MSLGFYHTEKKQAYLSLYGLTSNNTISLLGELRLLNGGVDCTKTLQALLELRRQTLVRLRLGREKGVTTDVGLPYV